MLRPALSSYLRQDRRVPLAALPGIVSGSLLAVARAAGETAPLLFAVGAANEFNPHFFEQANTALSIQIFGNATSSFVAAQDRAWGAALTLVVE